MAGDDSEPFFERPHAGERRRLLLVSYHFPPAETAGAFRWQQLADHAARRGWSLDVVTRDPGALDDAASRRLQSLPLGIRLFGIPDVTPGLERLERRVLAWLRPLRRRGEPRPGHAEVAGASASRAPSPDSTASAAPAAPSSLGRAEIGFQADAAESWLRAYTARLTIARERAWAAAAAATGGRILAPGLHRLLVSCGPPHWADHRAAQHLARRSGLPWVMDLRDPWSLVERLPASLASPLWLRTAARDEARAVREASWIVMNTEPARDAMRGRHPASAGRIDAILNGVDGGPLPCPPAAAAERARRFIVAYAGTVYLDRDPRSLFRAAARVAEESGLRPERFGIEFMGEAPPGSIEAMAEEEGIGAFVRVHPAGSRQAASEFLARASVLLNLPQDSHLAVPSKIFEYMRFGASILALAAPESATAALLRGTDADVIAPDDEDRIADALRRRLREYEAGRRPTPLAADPRFDRRRQADLLLDGFERLAAGRS